MHRKDTEADAILLFRYSIESDNKAGRRADVRFQICLLDSASHDTFEAKMTGCVTGPDSGRRKKKNVFDVRMARQ